MKVVVRELGSRPSIMTPARINAPQAAKALADIMAEEDYADLCVINLDWQGDGFTPALVIYTVRFLPEIAPENLQHFWPIDMEDAFGADEKANRELLLNINDQLKEMYTKTVARRRAKEASGTWVRPGENVKYIDG